VKFTFGSILALIGTLAADFTIDSAQLAAGSPVKVGQVASLEGKPVYVYLSENPALT